MLEPCKSTWFSISLSWYKLPLLLHDSTFRYHLHNCPSHNLYLMTSFSIILPWYNYRTYKQPTRDKTISILKSPIILFMQGADYDGILCKDWEEGPRNCVGCHSREPRNELVFHWNYAMHNKGKVHQDIVQWASVEDKIKKIAH